MKVTIIDYGLGNLLSIQRAFEYCGAEVNITQNSCDILTADRLVLPGVGAYQDGMIGLKQHNLIQAIQQFVSTGKPFLGICLGMQLMMDSSEEFGYCDGLGLIKGPVKAIPDTGVDGQPHKIPHIGWKALQHAEKDQAWENTILSGLRENEFVYFVHSYVSIPIRDENRLADCFYNGQRLCAVIREGNAYGCQYHPEKSGPVGISILKNWLQI
ncbi:MAG: hisH [Anaerosporomusa subterranea]|jgi:glutamine amidotransferase|nr:hisH [Anaerosporomusa subterranea]